MACSVAGQLWREARSALGAGVDGFHLENHQNSALTAHTDLATASSLSNRSASTMEISSMTSLWQLSQPCRTPGRWARVTHWARGARPEPMPMSDTIQPVLRFLPFLNPDLPSFPSHKPGWLPALALGALTCKGMECGTPDVAGCHPSAGSGHSACGRQ